jgi:membrane protease YdiL (CAAX protease family)
MAFEPTPPRKPRPQSIAVPWGPRDTIISIVIALGITLVSSVALGVVFALTSDSTDVQELDLPGWAVIVPTLILQVTLVVTAYALGPARYKVGPRFLGIGRIPLGTVLRWGFVALLLNLAFNAVYSILLQTFAPEALPDPIPPELQNASALWLVVVVALGAPITEEIYFRGFVFQGLAGSIGVVGAACASALLFGVVHALSGVAVIPVALFAGLVFAFVFYRTGSIWPSMLAHVGQNALALYSVFNPPQG